MAEIHIINHPLLETKLSVIRDKNTSSEIFRLKVDEVVSLLAFEATKGLKTKEIEVQTPVGNANARTLKSKPLIVPILRAGLGMLNGMMRTIPEAEIGFLGMKRNEETLENETYANRLPQDLKGRQCILVDPMLATGGTIVNAAKHLSDLGADDITAICLLGAPEGIQFIEENVDDSIHLKVFLPKIDKKLNENGYIIPGLGDAGDRLYGLVD